MSGEESSTAFSIPDKLAAHVGQETQYGMTFPDGSVSWNKVTLKGRDVLVERIAQGESAARDWWRDYLKDSAATAKINAYDHSNGHKIITRTVVLAVTEAADHADLRPWGAPGGTLSAPPVPAPKPPAAPWS